MEIPGAYYETNDQRVAAFVDATVESEDLIYELLVDKLKIDLLQNLDNIAAKKAEEANMSDIEFRTVMAADIADPYEYLKDPKNLREAELTSEIITAGVAIFQVCHEKLGGLKGFDPPITGHGRAYFDKSVGQIWYTMRFELNAEGRICVTRSRVDSPSIQMQLPPEQWPTKTEPVAEGTLLTVEEVTAYLVALNIELRKILSLDTRTISSLISGSVYGEMADNENEKEALRKFLEL